MLAGASGAALLIACAASLRSGAVRAQDGGAPRISPTLPDMGPLVTVEPVFNLGTRRRADGAVQASTEDEALARWNVGGSSDPRHPSNRAGFHVAPRIVVDTEVRGGRLPARSAAKGVLSRLAVLAQSRNRGYWPFRVCFESGLRRDAALRGKVEVRFSIGVTGRVTASRLLGADLKDAEVARCVATRARGLSFSPPPPRRVDVDMTVELNPGDAPLPGVRLPEAEAPRPGPPPQLTGAQLRQAQAALTLRTEALAACYTSARTRDQGLWGRIGLRMTVSSGRVLRVAQHESRFPDESVVACVAAAVQGTPFCEEVTSPVELEWGVRLGSPPAPAAPVPTTIDKSVVAETAPARLPVDN